MESSCAPLQAPSEEASELARLREIAALREIEMDEARQIQALLRPTGPLRGPNFEIACSSVPFSEVSGDFADYFELPNGMVGIYLGDVAGKGLPAAMYGALAMGTLRGTDKTGKSTNGVLEMLNTRLRARPSSGRFCATIYALLNPATLELQFSNAGLPYPLHSLIRSRMQTRWRRGRPIRPASRLVLWRSLHQAVARRFGAFRYRWPS